MKREHASDDNFGLEKVKSVESDVSASEKKQQEEQSKNTKNESNNKETNDDAETATQHINTSETKTLDDSDREVLIGKDIETVEEVEEEFNSLQRKLLNKLT